MGTQTSRQTIVFWLMTASSVVVAVGSYRFLFLGIDGAFRESLGATAVEPQLYLAAHVIAAPVALLLGGFQFLSSIRARYPQVHRWVGRTYAVAVLVGGVSALLMAIDEWHRLASALGFGALAMLWLWCTAQAVRHARAQNYEQHRRMMIRSFALTFAAVTLRLQLPFLLADGSTYVEASRIVSWSCWIPNILFAEWWLRRKSARPSPRF